MNDDFLDDWLDAESEDDDDQCFETNIDTF